MNPARSRPLLAWLSVIGPMLWLVGFCAVFFSLSLPNNPGFSRWVIGERLPEVFSTLINAPEERLAFLSQRVPFLGLALVLFLGALGIGDAALRLLKVPLSSDLDRFVLGSGLGLSLVSLITLGLGLAGGLSMVLLAVLLEAGLVLDVALARRNRSTSAGQPLSAPRASGDHASRASTWLFTAACAVFAIVILLGACLPSVDFDVNAYHFVGPKEYFQAGRVQFLRHNVYTSFPFLTEMLTLAGMVLTEDWLAGALVGKVLLSVYAPLTALGLYAAGRRWFGSLAGLAAALVYLSLPWTYRISATAYVEGALSFYLMASLWVAGLAIEDLRRDGPHSLRLFVLTGLLAGSGMACKYPGLISVIFPVAVFCALGAGWRKLLPVALAVALGVAVTIGPWLIKNTVETGNPVYPLLWTVFGGRDWDQASNDKWRRGHSAHSFTPREAALGVLEVTLRNDWLSPLLFGLAPLSLGLLRRPRRASSQESEDSKATDWQRQIILGLWLNLAWLVGSWWLLTHRIDRFFVPQHPLVAFLAGVGLANVLRHSGRVTQAVVWSVVAVVTVFNLGIDLDGTFSFSRLFLDLRAATRLVMRETAPEIAWLNRHLPPNAKVLCVGEAETFYARFPLVYNTVFDHSIFEEWCQGKDPAAIRQKLKDEGITHVYVNWLEVLRYRTTYGFTDFVTRQRFTDLQKAGVLAPPVWIIESQRRIDDQWNDARWKAEAQRCCADLIERSRGGVTMRGFEVYPVR